LDELEKYKEIRFNFEEDINTLVSELKIKDLKLETLKSKKDELNDKLQIAEERFIILNDKILNQFVENNLNMQDRSASQLNDALIDSKNYIEELKSKINDLESEFESSKIRESSKSKQIESLNKQIEELDTQLRIYKDKTILNNNLEKPNEPGILELSFRSFEGSRRATNPSIIDKRKDSGTTRKRYMLKTNHITNVTTSNYRQSHKPSIWYEEMKSVMSIRRKISINEPPKDIFLINYKGFGYICYDNHKDLRLIAYQNNVIYILDHKNMKFVYEIPILGIKTLEWSISNDFLYQISFFNEPTQKVETAILELPNGSSFYKAIQSSSYFDHSIVKNKALAIESNIEFRNASLNLFCSSKRSCILETWINSLSKDWSVDYYVIVDNVLLKFNIPLKFKYNQYSKIIRKPYMYFLENYNLIKNEEKIGLKRPNTFALKIHNENQDIVLASLMEEEKETWVNLLS